MYKVSDVERMAVSGQLGSAFGFNILTSQGQPVVNLSFRTEVEAREALHRLGCRESHSDIRLSLIEHSSLRIPTFTAGPTRQQTANACRISKFEHEVSA
jgi:hypothetical protein